uniref:rRNA-processing protein UTP23 homolog n=1 Tax=Rhabditophanes sp. KR3021 TaxID=114890 RepID=A0AC35TKJ6_9BILA
MKAKRLKRAEKILNFFKFNHNLLSPYKVLVDGTFAMAALKDKVNIAEQLPKYLGGGVELVTTRCVLKELEKLGSVVFGGLHILKKMEVEYCPHTPEKCVGDCFAYLAKKSVKQGGSKRPVMVATNDRGLQDKIRLIPGIAILFLAYHQILLEDVGDASQSIESKIGIELERVQEMKKAVFGNDKAPVSRKRKIAKGPNPLSCKKKKVKDTTSKGAQEPEKSKTRRKKKSSTVGCNQLIPIA